VRPQFSNTVAHLVVERLILTTDSDVNLYHRSKLANSPPFFQDSAPLSVHFSRVIGRSDRLTCREDDPLQSAGNPSTEAHQPTAAKLVAEVSINLLAQGIRPQHERADPTKCFLGKTEFLLNPRNRKAKRLPASIVEQVATHRRQQHAPLCRAKTLHRPETTTIWYNNSHTPASNE